MMTRPGCWIGASYILGRDVPVTEPYPHVCNLRLDGRITPGLRVRLERRQCAACIQEANDRRRAPPDTLPPMTDEQRAEEARRMGERD